MTNYLRFRNGGGLVLLYALLGTLCKTGCGQIRYSVPEELEKGSFVGNIAKDLGLEPQELAERGVRIVSRGRTQLFALNPRSGSLVTAGRIDREELCAQSARCLTAFDPDAGMNSLLNYQLSPNEYFSLAVKGVSDGAKYPELVLQRALDHTHITLHVADINDNPPAFTHASYSAYIPENNPRGASIFSVTAQDPDSIENAHITYALTEDAFQGAPLSTYISINSDTGVLYALCSFDYEQVRNLELLVTASDSGNPPLSSNVSLSIFVLDQNDNAPEILYPTLPTDGSTGVELAPRSAEPGHVVTKVVAVDRDSGQNAWLSYRLLKASEPGLFAVGLHTGEVRTARALLDRDALKQSLVVAVQDHGQPPLSATVTLTVAVADSIPDVLAELGSLKPSADPDDSGLTLYLVVAVAAVSCVFLAFVVVLLALRLRYWHRSHVLQASGSVPVGVPASHFEGVDGVRAFLQTYSHEVSLTADSRRSHVIFPQPNYADTLVSQESCEKSEPLLISQDLLEMKGDPKQLQEIQYSISEELAKGSRVGNLAKDLRLSAQELPARKLQISAEEFFSMSAENGDLLEGVPFKLESTSKNYYKLVIDGALDREQRAEYNVTITATDKGKTPLSSSTSATLHIRDVTDNAPVFHQASYVAHVAENNPPGASIAHVSASDPDLGPNGHVSYSILASDLERRTLSSYVSVSAQSGVVFAQRAFDHEQLRAFELTLQARDHGSPALSANVSLRVLVGDRNDNAPRVLYPALGPDGSALFDTVPRAAQPGYLVTKVVAVDADSGHNAWLSYHVLQASEPGLFSVGLRTGEVRTARVLGDRDAARQRLLVAVRDGGQPPLSATATLLLVFADSLQEALPDLSDHSEPTDPQAELQFYLVVALALISVLFLLAVILAVALHLRRSSSPAAWSCFQPGLSSKSGPVVPPNYNCSRLIGICVLLGALWEIRAEHILYSVPEELENGSFVGNIAKDLGLEPRQLAERGVRIVSRGRTQLFALNPLSGSLVTAGRIDREELCDRSPKCVVNLEILLEDKVKIFGVEVEIIDINDNAPNFGAEQREIKVAENENPGTRFPLPEAFDPDIGINSLQGYQLSSNGHFSLDVQSGADGIKYPELVLERALDREEEAVHHLVLTAFDGGDRVHSGTTRIHVTLVDANDNAPVFTQPEYHGAPLSSYVSINSATGVLYALRSFDYEQVRDLQLLVTASDSGDPPLSSNVSLSIFVLDQNDNTPEILYPALPTDGSTGVELAPRSAEPGYLVTKVVAVDRDSGQNAWLSYRLLKASDPGLFAVGLHTGEVRTARALLDRDVLKQSLVVAVQDHGQPPLSATVTLTVAVADSIPDVLADLGSLKPSADPDDSSLTLYLVVAVAAVSCVFLAFVIALLALRLRRWHMSRLLQASGSRLASVPASHFVGVDGVRAFLQTYSHEVSLTADSRRSHVIFPQPNYADTLISQESCEKSGPLLISQDLLERKGEPSLQQEQSSSGGRQDEAERREERPSAVAADQIRYSIPEELAKNSVVGNLAKDLGLSVRDLPARKLRVTAEKVYFIVNPVDGGDPPLSGTTQIQIQVTDANDNAPVFSQDVYRVSLQEGVPPGFLVLQLTATDQDEGVNAEIIYSFHNVDEQVEQFFNLDRRTGEITTKDYFDFEIANSYTLTIEAKDPGDLAAHCSVQVEILDENDCAPEVIVTSIFTPLPEDSPPGTVIALIKTRDRDSGENGEVYCQILGKAEFILKSYSKNYYKLVTDRTLDREEIPEYNVTIMATDRGKQPLSSSISITLRLADVNDNAPVFHQASYVAHVAENNPPGASIAHVSASDPDLGPNGHVSYSILASDLERRTLSSYVSVSAQSGVVFAQRAFDHEQLRAFELTLQARDHGSPALSANVSLRVLVGDRNDNAPRVLYPALGPDGSALFDTVPRAAQPGYLVTKVVAVDADSGHNAWLSYHVLQASEPGLFSVGLRTGEVRTARVLGDRDAARQRLLVAVRDGGQPPLSATATLLLVFADSLQEALPDLSDHSEPTDPQAELQFYLVVALALISVLFLLAVILAVALHLRRSSSPAAWSCFQPGLSSKSGPVVPPNYIMSISFSATI
ncbi:hypothetical protein J1605_014643 [Eschrichtius robustus]|uniref:Cadherin domain-containing protein n=1 Tax=Eschrichtius robustus TaxID=9764 RepID=A0AB34GEA7_ESCRO|nr:hypothetical protein J1605_014643 [Eschrichtius robustus]